MKLGDKGKKLIQDFEQFRVKLYDTDGAGHCTVGWGHLVHRGLRDGRENEKQFAKGISKSRGDELFFSMLSMRKRLLTNTLKAIILN